MYLRYFFPNFSGMFPQTLKLRRFFVVRALFISHIETILVNLFNNAQLTVPYIYQTSMRKEIFAFTKFT